MIGRRRTWLRRAAAAGTAVSTVALCAAWTPVLGQEAGGPLLTFGVSSTLSASDNLDLDPDSEGNTILSETRLSFGFESITRVQTFSFSLSDDFRFGDGPGAPADADFQGIDAALFYERRGANSRFEFAASLDTRDLDADLTEADFEQDDDLIVDTGTLALSRLSFGLETGLNSPFGSELTMSYTRRDYTDTTDPDLEDSSTLQGSASLIFRPDTVTELRTTYSQTEYEADDAEGTERSTRSLSFSASRELDTATRISGSVGWTVIEETLTAIPLTLPDEEGLTATLGYYRDLPAGSFAVDLSHDITSAGYRTDLSVTRGFDLPTGELVLTLGATRPEGSGIEPTGSVVFIREFPDQTLSLALSSEIRVSDDSEVQRNTSAVLGYSLALTEIDSLAFDLDYTWITDAGAGTTADRTRATATASYRRDLTRDWTLSTGYTHRLSEEDADTARSNTLFLTLERDFAWRP